MRSAVHHAQFNNVQHLAGESSFTALDCARFQSTGLVQKVLHDIDIVLPEHFPNFSAGFSGHVKDVVTGYVAAHDFPVVTVSVSHGLADIEMSHLASFSTDNTNIVHINTDAGDALVTVYGLNAFDEKAQLEHILRRLQFMKTVMAMLSTTDMVGTSQVLGNHLAWQNILLMNVQRLGKQIEGLSRTIGDALHKGEPLSAKVINQNVHGIVKQLAVMQDPTVPPQMQAVIRVMTAQVKDLPRHLPILKNDSSISIQHKTAIRGVSGEGARPTAHVLHLPPPIVQRVPNGAHQQNKAVIIDFKSAARHTLPVRAVMGERSLGVANVKAIGIVQPIHGAEKNEVTASKNVHIPVQATKLGNSENVARPAVRDGTSVQFTTPNVGATESVDRHNGLGVGANKPESMRTTQSAVSQSLGLVNVQDRIVAPASQAAPAIHTSPSNSTIVTLATVHGGVSDVVPIKGNVVLQSKAADPVQKGDRFFVFDVLQIGTDTTSQVMGSHKPVQASLNVNIQQHSGQVAEPDMGRMRVAPAVVTVAVVENEPIEKAAPLTSSVSVTASDGVAMAKDAGNNGVASTVGHQSLSRVVGVVVDAPAGEARRDNLTLQAVHVHSKGDVGTSLKQEIQLPLLDGEAKNILPSDTVVAAHSEKQAVKPASDLVANEKTTSFQNAADNVCGKCGKNCPIHGVRAPTIEDQSRIGSLDVFLSSADFPTLADSAQQRPVQHVNNQEHAPTL